MALEYTEEKLNSLDKETVIRLFLAQQGQLKEIDRTLQLVLERECNRNCVSFSNLLSRFYQMPELSVKAGTLTLTGIPAFKAR